MSGGYFEYKHFILNELADQIDRLIQTNENPNEFGFARNFSEKTLDVFREASYNLRKAEVLAHRIDWLASYDDGEECFHRRLKEDLDKLNEN